MPLSPVQQYTASIPLRLESGDSLSDLTIAYQMSELVSDVASPVIWVCHALTANTDVCNWWRGLFGEDALFDPGDHLIVCANVLGSPYGTSNPLSVNGLDGQPYFQRFPTITIRDMVAAHQVLADHLGISHIDILIGGSLGGQQAVEWAISEPGRIKRLVLLASNAMQSPWGIAFNESQRMAIASDPTFHANRVDGGLQGLRTARSIAMLSYRTYETYCRTQEEANDERTDQFMAAFYQAYQGEKLARRFNAYSYWSLTKSMDSHNVGRHRGGASAALARVSAKTLVVGIDSDILFPLIEQKFLAAHIPNARLATLSSLHGHDSFLIETAALSELIGAFLQES